MRYYYRADAKANALMMEYAAQKIPYLAEMESHQMENGGLPYTGGYNPQENVLKVN